MERPLSSSKHGGSSVVPQIATRSAIQFLTDRDRQASQEIEREWLSLTLWMKVDDDG
jgi:hypothetical protein